MVHAMQETCISFPEPSSENSRLICTGSCKGGGRNGGLLHPAPCGPLEAPAGNPVDTGERVHHSSAMGLRSCQVPSLHRECSVAPLCAGPCVVGTQCGNASSAQRAAEGLGPVGGHVRPPHPAPHSSNSRVHGKQMRRSQRAPHKVPSRAAPIPCRKIWKRTYPVISALTSFAPPRPCLRKLPFAQAWPRTCLSLAQSSLCLRGAPAFAAEGWGQRSPAREGRRVVRSESSGSAFAEETRLPPTQPASGQCPWLAASASVSFVVIWRNYGSG